MPNGSVLIQLHDEKARREVRTITVGAFCYCATMSIQMAVRFEWDEPKNRANIVKHGISFETAKLVFDDPQVVSFPERNVEGEERWQSLGSADSIVILTVAHMVQDSDGDEVVRIISARKASPSERRRYANQETEKRTRSPRCNAR